MAKVLSGIQPTGEIHIGNYIGALKHWKPDPGNLYPVVDLHAITMEHDPKELHDKILGLSALLLALGLGDPSIVFVQSQVHEHAELAWLLNSVARFGELNRMTQFKSKGKGHSEVSAGLFNYPVLMAADILLYQTEEVPVGDDQKQHVELTRDIAQRFNSHYGPVFRVPEPKIPKMGARVMSLTRPHEKMSKSDPDPNSKVLLTDSDEVIRKKILSAVTDSGREVYRDEKEKPGITNLLDMAAVLSGESVQSWEDRYKTAGYGAFKKAVADAVVEAIGPLRQKVDDIVADKTAIEASLSKGRERAQALARPTLNRAKEAMGFPVF